MKKYLLFVFCLYSIPGLTQDVSGIWRGHFLQSGTSGIPDLLGGEDRYKFEVQLDQHSKDFEGVTYSYKTTEFYGKASCKGAVNPSSHKVILEEMKMLELRMTTPGDACIMTCFLQYSKMGGEEFLEGTYFSTNTRDSSNCGRGTVFLRKVNNSDFYEEPFIARHQREEAARKKRELAARKKQNAHSSAPKEPEKKEPVTTEKRHVVPKENLASNQPALKPVSPVGSLPREELHPGALDTLHRITEKPAPIITPQVIADRKNELVKTIMTDAREIQVDVYDNGTIDNDSISLYLDKRPILLHQRLTDQALTVKFRMDDNETGTHELVLVADNLGDIPPNTSLMVVKAGDKQYEVNISSTEQKNAVLIFKYNKKE